MKVRVIYLAIFSMVASFSTIPVAAQKNDPFTYPEEAIADTAKQSFVKQFNQGKILYGISCAKCHNKKIGGKEVIPDFSLPQLMDYEMRMYVQHEDKLDDKHVQDVELQKIIVFLRYKKKTGVYITPPPKDPSIVDSTKSSASTR